MNTTNKNAKPYWLSSSKRLAKLALWTLLTFVDCITARATDTPVQDAPSIQSALAIWDAWLTYHVDRQQIPALSVDVVWHGQRYWHGTYSSARKSPTLQKTDDPVYRVGSLTKPLTAAAILQLRDAGKLTLDARLNDLLGPTHFADASVGNITVKQLLTHTSGLPFDFDQTDYWHAGHFPDSGTVFAALQTARLTSVSGTQWKYSNLGYATLGLIIEKLSGLPYGDYVDQRLLQPLQMNHSAMFPLQKVVLQGFDYHTAQGRKPAPFFNMRGMASAGNLASTSADLSTFSTLFFADAWRPPGTVLSGASSLAMGSLQWHDPGSDTGWGLGWGVSKGGQHIQHEGGVPGYSAVISIYPEDGFSVVALLNVTDGAAYEVSNRATRWLLPALRVMADVTVAKPVPARLQQYLGRYVGEDGAEFDALYLDNELTLIDPSGNNPWQDRMRLREVGAGTYEMLNREMAGELLRFQTDRNGGFNALQLPGYSLQRLKRQ